MEKHVRMSSQEKSLINAVEFFSQRFDVLEIVHYALNFVKELMPYDRIALFTLIDDRYKVENVEGYDNHPLSFEAVDAYKNSVMLHAGLFMKEDLQRTMPVELLELYPATMGIPLIMDKELYGMILLESQMHTDDSFIIGMALMNLFYSALTNYKWFHELDEVKKSLDEKIFSLFAINQSSRVLMSTLDIKEIANLGISVFSELTQSSVTSLYVFDEVTEKFMRKGYHNVRLLGDKDVGRIGFWTDGIGGLGSKRYLKMDQEADRAIFAHAFENGEELIASNSIKLLIPIAKYDHIIGFITLSDRVNGQPFHEGLLELIDSLASSLYIAISNGKAMLKVQEQNAEISERAAQLQAMHNLAKNINSSTSIEHLYEITMDTFHYSYGVEAGFVAEYDSDCHKFIIRASKGMPMALESLEFEQSIDKLQIGEVVIAATIDEATDIMDEALIAAMKDAYAGLVLLPVTVLQADTVLLGLIGVLDVKEKHLSDQNQLLLFETIAGTIAPMWQQLKVKDGTINNEALTDVEILERMWDGEVEAMALFQCPFTICHLYRKDQRLIFEDPYLALVASQNSKSHRIGQHLIIFDVSKEKIMGMDQENPQGLPEGYGIDIYEYGRDMTSFLELIDLLGRNG